MTKKQIRQKFRDEVFKRANYCCEFCSKKGKCRQSGESKWAPPLVDLDAHHITDRHEFPNGGYVKENGISLCSWCHEKAEEYHFRGTGDKGFSPQDLYKIIGSNKDRAMAADLRNNG